MLNPFRMLITSTIWWIEILFSFSLVTKIGRFLHPNNSIPLNCWNGVHSLCGTIIERALYQKYKNERNVCMWWVTYADRRRQLPYTRILIPILLADPAWKRKWFTSWQRNVWPQLNESGLLFLLLNIKQYSIKISFLCGGM